MTHLALLLFVCFFLIEVHLTLLSFKSQTEGLSSNIKPKEVSEYVTLLTSPLVVQPYLDSNYLQLPDYFPATLLYNKQSTSQQTTTPSRSSSCVSSPCSGGVHDDGQSSDGRRSVEMDLWTLPDLFPSFSSALTNFLSYINYSDYHHQGDDAGASVGSTSTLIRRANGPNSSLSPNSSPFSFPAGGTLKSNANYPAAFLFFTPRNSTSSDVSAPEEDEEENASVIIGGKPPPPVVVVPQREPKIKVSMLMHCLEFCSSIRHEGVKETEWEILHESKACTVWRRRKGSSQACEYLAHGRFDDISVVSYNMTVNQIVYRREWDTHAVDIKVVNTYPVSNQDKKILSQDSPTEFPHSSSNKGGGTTCAPNMEPRLKKRKQGWKSVSGESAGGSLEPSAPTCSSSSTSSKTTPTSSSNSSSSSDYSSSYCCSPPYSLILKDKKSEEEILYWRFRIPFPLIKDRDFVFARRFATFTKADDEEEETKPVGLVCVQESAHDEKCKDVSGCVRIKDYRTGLALFALNGDIHKIGMEYVLYHYDDPRSKLPSRVKSYLAAQALPISMKELHKKALQVQKTHPI